MSSEHCFRCVPLRILLLLSRYSATSILSPPLTQELFNEKIFFISKLGFFPISFVMHLEFLLHCGGECGLCHVSCLEFIEFFSSCLIYNLSMFQEFLKKTYLLSEYKVLDINTHTPYISHIFGS